MIILWQDWVECAFSIKEMEAEAATGRQNWTWNLSLKILKDPGFKKKLSMFNKNPYCVPIQNFIDAQDLIDEKRLDSKQVGRISSFCGFLLSYI